VLKSRTGASEILNGTCCDLISRLQEESNMNTKVTKLHLKNKFLFASTMLLPALLALAPVAIANEAALQIFEEVNYQGTPSTLETYTYYSGDTIPNGLNGKTSSLILKKGYQACIATEENGQGLSKMLIAINRDIRIPRLSPNFNDAIALIRVTPFRNVAKRGHCGGPDPRYNAAWFYTWGGVRESTETLLFSPMIHRPRVVKGTITNLTERKGIQEVIGFNEPDSPDKRLGVKPERAPSLLKNALSLGLRIGTPSCREGGAGQYLPLFIETAKAEKLRIDFVCVHWYDRKAVRRKKSASPEAIFKRFQKYMTDVHDQYGLPIWITEWNANPARETPVQRAFMQMAFEWMDTTPWIERYAWFQPRPVISQELRDTVVLDIKGGDKDKAVSELRKQHAGYGDFIIKPHFDPARPLTELGQYWSNFKSAPSMAKDVYLGKNNLCEDEVEEGHFEDEDEEGIESVQ
jgi:hypothetical protein